MGLKIFLALACATLAVLPLLGASYEGHKNTEIMQGAAFAPDPRDIFNKTVFPADNIWNAPVDALPLDSNSADYIANMDSATALHSDFGTEWMGAPIGIPYCIVPGTQPKVPVFYTAYGDQSDPGPFPIPQSAPVEGGPNGTGDRHVLVIDQDNWILYELYNARPNPNGSWNASSGAMYDLKSNALRPDGWTSADAAGLPIFPGLVTYDEVASGAINHAIRFTVEHTQKAYVWPARHYASSNTNPDLPPMGLRLRLKAGVDISTYAAPLQVIMQAMKTYGLIVADNGGDWYISGAPDIRWDDDMLHNINGLCGSDFEVVDCSGLMESIDSGKVKGGAVPDIMPGFAAAYCAGFCAFAAFMLRRTRKAP